MPFPVASSDILPALLFTLHPSFHQSGFGKTDVGKIMFPTDFFFPIHSAHFT